LFSLYVPQALSIKGLQRIEQKKSHCRITARARGPTLPARARHSICSSLCRRHFHPTAGLISGRCLGQAEVQGHATD
jgi:hypothetical protein